MYKVILVPLDGSVRAEAILPHVDDLARCYRAKVVFLQVVEPEPLIIGPDVVYPIVNLCTHDLLNPFDQGGCARHHFKSA